MARILNDKNSSNMKSKQAFKYGHFNEKFVNSRSRKFTTLGNLLNSAMHLMIFFKRTNFRQIFAFVYF
jgi:hypothetical protein